MVVQLIAYETPKKIHLLVWYNSQRYNLTYKEKDYFLQLWVQCYSHKQLLLLDFFFFFFW